MSKINVSVDCVIFGFDDEEKKLKVLLIEKKTDPYSKDNHSRRQFALPGDLIKTEEDINNAAKRILFSLTKLDNLYLKQYKCFGDPKRLKDKKDQEWLSKFRSNPDERVITIGYVSVVRMEDYTPEASYFAENISWIQIDELPEMAFDHNTIIKDAISFLRKEINQEVTSELLPRKFTLSQLQELHEIILDEKLDKRNFRKQVINKGILSKTNEKQKGVSHKPAELYQFIEQ